MPLFDVITNPYMNGMPLRERTQVQFWMWQADFFRWRHDGVWRWLAWKMPRKLVYWCGIRLAAQPPFFNRNPDSIGIMETLTEWEKVTDGKQAKD